MNPSSKNPSQTSTAQTSTAQTSTAQTSTAQTSTAQTAQTAQTSTASVQEKSIQTGRFSRAFQIGKIAAKITGSAMIDQFKKSDQSMNASIIEATKQNAKMMVKTMGEMKGAAMKLGQFLSMDPDMIDPDFAKELAVLQKEAPPVPFKDIQTAVEKRLNQTFEQCFHFFDPKPLGTASIGQVHYAILKDGREVAVKVQYEGIKDSLESDLKNIGILLKLSKVVLSAQQIDGLLKEIRESLVQEADYLKEAQNLIDFAKHFEHIPNIRIPKPYLEYSTSELLVMEYMPGKPLIKGLNAIDSFEKRSEIVKSFIQIFVFAFHELHELNVDPHPGNFLLNDQHQIVLLDFGCTKKFNPQTSDLILKALQAFWQDDMPKLKSILQTLGFGREGIAYPADEDLRTHQQMMLAPMAKHELFNFSQWQIHDKLREFLLSHSEFINMIPPPELLMYFRVLAGIKGTLTQVDAGVNIRKLAEDACLKRGIVP
jgi:predicted unusual protein kinase regulating ubiquinone biosynthesis (AarF/ABC1/UbiB family)